MRINMAKNTTFNNSLLTVAQPKKKSRIQSTFSVNGHQGRQHHRKTKHTFITENVVHCASLWELKSA